MKFKSLICVFICAALLLCGCGTEIQKPIVVSIAPEPDLPPVREPYPVSFDGETFESSPLTVASLSPALTEVIFDLGMGSRLVGVSDYCDYPSDAVDMPKIGSPAKPDIQKITELAPELLVLQSPIAATDMLALKKAGIRVLSLDQPQNFAQLCEIYIKLAMVFLGSQDAQTTAESLLSDLDAALLQASESGVSKTFTVVEDSAEGGLMLSPGRTLCSDIFSVFGINLWQNGQQWFVSDEELFYISPEVVFYSSLLDKDDIAEVFPHSQLISFDMSRFERPTVRLAETVKNCFAELSE